MKKGTLFGMMTALALCLTAGARTVSVPTYVCNPGAAVTVPVALDEAGGLACATMKLTYDAQVLVPEKVEVGSLGAAFGDEPVVSSAEAGVVFAGLFSEKAVAAGGGTVAVVTFRVREGTEGLFSDLTVAEVTLGTADGLNAETRENPTHVVHGMVRVVGADADVERLEQAQVVCAGTSVGSLTLAAGDCLAADGDLGPVSVAGEVTAAGAVPVVAPAGGWSDATYRLLTTTTADLTLELQGLQPEDGLALKTVAEEDGRVTYVAEVTPVRPPAVDPEDPQTYGDAEKARAAAAAINADRVALIKTPQGASAERYTSLFTAVVSGDVVEIVLNGDGTNELEKAANALEAAVGAGLGGIVSAAAGETIDLGKVVDNVEPGFWYGVAASPELGGLKATMPASWVQATTEGVSLTVRKPATGNAAFFQIKVKVK